MPLSRPMPSIEPGAAVLRIRDLTGIYRAFYYSRSPRGILVFHAFVKKTQATPKRELDLGKKRLVGVGIAIAHDPLHGSGRAELPHPALA